MKRYLWMIGSGIAIVLAIIVAGMTYAAHFASTIYMTDFGIQPPNLGNIAIAQNKVEITLTFTAQAA